MQIRGTAVLPFVCVVAGGRDYWFTEPETGNWGEDNKIGRGYANALVAWSRDGELGMILGHVSEAITRKGRFEGIEVGFFNRLGEIIAERAQIALAQAA